MNLQFMLFILINGLSQGMVLFIIASGLSLVFGVLRVINFAHGSLYMIGAFMAFSLSSLFAGKTLFAFLMLMLLVPPGVAILGLGLEVSLFRRIYRKEHLLQLLLTYSLVLILDGLTRLIWGGQIRNVPRPEVLAGSLDLFGLYFPSYNLFLLIVGPLLAAGLWILLYRSRAGNYIRAAVTYPEMLGALGVNVPRVMTWTFMLGCFLAGLGGVFMSALANIDLSIGMERIIECFAVVVIGGLGSLPGAALGAVIVGLVRSAAIHYAPAVELFVIYFVMALVLAVRPRGLFSLAEPRKI